MKQLSTIGWNLFDFSAAQELKAIPGAEHMYSIDCMPLSVVVRKGTHMVLHPDQVKQWTNAGLDFADKFEEVKRKHDEKYLNLLAPLISQGGQPAAGSSSQDIVPAEETEETGTDSSTTKPTTFESIEKLKESEEITVRCLSETPGVELIKRKSGKVMLLSEHKDRILSKWTLLASFGTGKYHVLKSGSWS